MAEDYDARSKFYLGKDENGRVNELRPADRNEPTSQQLPQQAAAEFLIEHSDVLDIDPSWLTGEGLHGVAVGPGEPVTADGIELRYAGEKQLFDTSTVAFQQTWRGLEVWRCGLTVTVRSDPARVAVVANNTWREIDVDAPKATVLKRAVAGERGLISEAVGTTLTVRAARTTRPATATDARRKAETGRTQIDIVSDRIVVFRYSAATRITDEKSADGDGSTTTGSSGWSPSWGSTGPPTSTAPPSPCQWITAAATARPTASRSTPRATATAPAASPTSITNSPTWAIRPIRSAWPTIGAWSSTSWEATGSSTTMSTRPTSASRTPPATASPPS